MTADALGDRMKGYEQAEAGRTLLPGLPVLARIDGRCFHRWTRGLQRPFDEGLVQAMIATTGALVRDTGALVGYTQSDEISLLWHYGTAAEPLFGGRVQKTTSLLASLATAEFNQRAGRVWPDKKAAQFDTRVWVVPSRDEAANAFLWRELDATKNSIQMLARSHFSHAALQGQNTRQMLAALEAAGVRWDELPDRYKRGTWVQRVATTGPIDAAELARLPPRHDAHRNPGMTVTRHTVTCVPVPPFGRVVNRVAFLFDGDAPAPAAAA